VLPARAKYLIVGAGLHGLSTAYHLGKELAARGTGSGADIVILEKSHPGAGASGIACGVVRNNYFQPAMQELMQACVEVWESDPAAYSYNPVGYMAIGPKVQESDLTAVYERQQKIGYSSTFVTGEGACDAYMKAIFPDWRARGVTAVLHEHKGGFAHNLDSVAGMQAKAESTGAQLITGV
jgi:glycine/D-amino acid oxidase-like deaminating enzyme